MSVSRQPAHSDSATDFVGCCYFLPGLKLSSQLLFISIIWPVSCEEKLTHERGMTRSLTWDSIVMLIPTHPVHDLLNFASQGGKVRSGGKSKGL